LPRIATKASPVGKSYATAIEAEKTAFEQRNKVYGCIEAVASPKRRNKIRYRYINSKSRSATLLRKKQLYREGITRSYYQL
jgi:hypothetical protein